MSPIEQYRILKRESRNRMGSIATTVLVVSLATLVLGLLWKEKYESSTTILVEEQEPVTPLSENRRGPEVPRDNAEFAREVLFHRDVMNAVLEAGGWLDEDPTPLEREKLIELIKLKLTVANAGENLVALSFRDPSPERAFRTLLEISNLFVSRARSREHASSQAAYEFVSAETDRYREKLQQSERRLQEFLAQHGNVRPGSGDDMDSRGIELLRDMQQTSLDLEEARVRVRALESQLNGESPAMASLGRQSELRQSIAELQNQLDTLRLQYHDTYPDIVSLKHKIETLRERLRDEEQGKGSADGERIAPNPMHEEIRAELTSARTEVAALEQRLARTESLLADARNRGSEIGDIEAQAEQLTREYEVTKRIYEDLLQRRESARIAVNMTEAGDRLTLSVQEPPTLPQDPSGLRFLHFALAGPLLGLGFAFGLLFLRLRFDERIRSSGTIARDLQIPVLTTVPLLVDENARSRERRLRGTVIAAALMLAACYGLVAALRMTNFI